MNKVFFSVLCVAGLLSATASAGPLSKTVAPPVPEIAGGLYLGPFGGINLYQNANMDGAGPGDEGSLDSTLGWFAGLKIGYLFADPGLFRPALELEGFYNKVETEMDGLFRGVTYSGGADFHTANIMCNLIGKFDLGQWQPYLGTGLGAAHIWNNDRSYDLDEPIDGRTHLPCPDESEWVFAYQGLAGIDYRLSETVSLFTEYKAMVYSSPLNFHGDYLHHLLGLGLRLNW